MQGLIPLPCRVYAKATVRIAGKEPLLSSSHSQGKQEHSPTELQPQHNKPRTSAHLAMQSFPFLLSLAAEQAQPAVSPSAKTDQ